MATSTIVQCTFKYPNSDDVSHYVDKQETNYIV